ncbi:MAG: RNA polymerase sigma-70 factor [Bacteroidota bacterium]
MADLTSSPPDLQDLCRRLRASDRSAFEVVFRTLRRPLLRYVRTLVFQADLAHDLVQDVFVDLWAARHRLDPSRSLKAYLYSMTRNRALRHLRDERLHASKEDDIRMELRATSSAPARADEVVDATALASQVQRWVTDLPNRQREALLLSRYHHLSHREIGALMGISPRTVNNHLVRALETLQQRMSLFESTPPPSS